MSELVFARGLGNLSFICPACHAINGPKRIDWRRARVRCLSDTCNRRFMVGFLFQPMASSNTAPPFNAWTAAFRHGSRHVNRLYGPGALPDEGNTEAVIAAYTGPLEYLCPTCHAWNQARANRFGYVTCSACTDTWNVGVILWQDARLRCPIDWSVNRELQDPTHAAR